LFGWILNYFEFPHLVLQVVPINALAALAA
jgi:hypothetical protein